MVVHLWHVSCLYTVCMHNQVSPSHIDHMHTACCTRTLSASATYFCTQHTTTLQLFFFKMAEQCQIHYKEYIVKILEREGLMVHQVGERLDAYDRQLHVVSIQT